MVRNSFRADLDRIASELTRHDHAGALTTDGDWLERSRDALARTALAPQAETVGRVEQVADGIALVSGLPDVAARRIAAFRGRTGSASR